MAILRSSPKAAKLPNKPFKELISRIGRRSQPAAPNYADSTKLGNAYIWDRWTQYVYSHTHRLFLSSWAEANIP